MQQSPVKKKKKKKAKLLQEPPPKKKPSKLDFIERNLDFSGRSTTLVRRTVDEQEPSESKTSYNVSFLAANSAGFRSSLLNLTCVDNTNTNKQHIHDNVTISDILNVPVILASSKTTTTFSISTTPSSTPYSILQSHPPTPLTIVPTLQYVTSSQNTVLTTTPLNYNYHHSTHLHSWWFNHPFNT